MRHKAVRTILIHGEEVWHSPNTIDGVCILALDDVSSLFGLRYDHWLVQALLEIAENW